MAHLWSSHHENVHFYGNHTVDIDSELAKLNATAAGPCTPPARTPEVADT